MVAASSSLTSVGEVIAGRYIVEEALGRGGMATVYRVRDQVTGTHCALKRARPPSPGTEKRSQQLLAREYYTLAQLAHPRIIAVYDFGFDEHGPYYTMELLGGSDLASLGPVPWPKACALLRDVASSLAVLHSRGLLHRDVSARNVRCSEAGSAKLIDFGALCSIGVVLEVVGTPPFVAPEALQMQALDARADLFSLGALGYHLLTGRHAYPARQLRELRDVWRSSPAAPARLVQDLPPALNQLILELLTLDRNARPQTAAEIIQRLCTIAQLPFDDEIAVSRAYLTAPALVGREHALITARKTLLSLPRGDGQTLLVEGPPGSGRSRMLDASVLEGKLLGALVLRANAANAGGGDWAVARSLTAQLLPWVADKIDDAARLSRDVLAHVVEGLTAEPPRGPPPDRSLLIRELRDFILAVSAGQRLLIAVDDADRIDELSLALLAALAHKTQRHPLVLALSAERRDGPPLSASMRLLQSVATRIELTPLTPDQTEALLRSVFGNVPNLPFVAAHIQRVAQGNARVTMELAEQLVERGLCRYEAGSWLLPGTLADGDLPSSLAASLEARLHGLSADARALCEVASIPRAPALPLSWFDRLSDGWPPERVFATLHELVTGRVLVADSEYYHFSQHGYADAARALMTPERRRTLHARMAEMLAAEGGDTLTRAYHLLQSEQDEAAIELLQSLDDDRRHPPVALLLLALERAQARGLPVRAIEDLRVSLMMSGALVLDVGVFQRMSGPVLQRLTHDSGLALYDQLAELPAQTRLTEALARTHARYLETPEHERGYPVDVAIRKLARLSNAFGVIGVWSGDISVFRSFPDLAPFAPLSQAVVVLSDMFEATRDWHTGRYARAIASYERVLERTAHPDELGLEPVQVALMRSVCLVLLGTLEAPNGIARCEERARLLEDHRAFRVNTWRIRQLFHVSQGDAARARQCMRRAELLQLQEGLEEQADGGNEGVALLANVHSEDLLGIQSALADLAQLAEQLPYWRIAQRLGQSTCLRLQGDAQAALEVLRPVFELAVPGEHWLFGAVAAEELRLLVELGQWAEAISRGERYLAIVQREELVSGFEIKGPLGLALACADRGEEGLRLIESWLDDLRDAGQTGILVGSAYESAARVCLRMNDRAGFERFAELCARIYEASRNPVLSAKLARLRAAADPATEPVLSPRRAAEAATLESEYETIHSRMGECIDGQDRARCALTLLMQQAERFAGYLYGIAAPDRVELACALPEEPEAGLTAWVRTWFESEIALYSGDVQTAVGLETETDLGQVTEDAASAAVASASAPLRYRDREGHVFEPLLMTAHPDSEMVAVAVLVLQVNIGLRTPPDPRILEQLAELMLIHGDVGGAVLPGSGMLETRTL